MSNSGNISRRHALKLAGAGLAGTAALATPAIASDASKVIRWKMVTSWPKNLPGPGVSAQRICDRIKTMSNGRLEVDLYSAGELVPAFEVFDAVAGGAAQMGHSAAFYWQGKVPASVFFTTVPYGLTPNEHSTWIEFGGGQELWDELYAPFNLKPFMGGNTAGTMAGWFKDPVTKLDDLQGLKIRIQGLGGEIMRRAGATPVTMPTSEMYSAMQSGVVDAIEFLGPASDGALGLQKIAKHYYGPGANKPNGTGEATVNLEEYNALPADLQMIVAEACRSEHAQALAEATWHNAVALANLQSKYDVQVLGFPADVTAELKRLSAVVMDEFVEEHEGTQKVFESYNKAKGTVSQWSDLSIRDYLIARDS
ncbi:TRAP transporter substrate-binding protein [Rhodobacteraceae bacterium RKSG542]|uniref:TRAP transporter substrate-binding protein n=1 Tax=Pseudovibrio flavus TaxID=2529854 RepID=UPI0012BC5AD0|nr:TRAP transporter substrate-binding protein [Pseudovibrio flavus]MTI19227.1 TRAP transporter substrate-binding protein [Pseudovibrio flavus]